MVLLIEDDVNAEFQNNIDSIATELIQTYSLKFKQEVEHLSEPLLRWLDFRYRYIDPQPRQIVFSYKFPKKNLPASTQKSLKKISRLIRAGSDINPYQGRGLILRHDSSGKRNENRTDLLWADWGIHHFHLSNEQIPTNQYFSLPADYLAFCLVGGNVVAFIDILRHPNYEGFANPELIQTVASSWPEYMKQFKLNEIHPGQGYTQSEIHTLRAAGIACFVKINNVAYMPPGMGLTSASTPLKITFALDHARKYARDLAISVCQPDGPFRTPEISSLRVAPHFSLVPTPSGLSVFESNTKCAFLLPSAKPNKTANNWEILHDLILPTWACKSLVARYSDIKVSK